MPRCSPHLRQLRRQALGVVDAAGEPGGRQRLVVPPRRRQRPGKCLQYVRQVQRQVVAHRRHPAVTHCLQHRREACSEQHPSRQPCTALLTCLWYAQQRKAACRRRRKVHLQLRGSRPPSVAAAPPATLQPAVPSAAAAGVLPVVHRPAAAHKWLQAMSTLLDAHCQHYADS